MDNTFDYVFLGRLQSDCEYFLHMGCRSNNNLWALDVKKQIALMKEYYNKLEKKPLWLTYEQILQYEKDMEEDEISC